jgi:phosphomethylpyrimidine synthase
VAILCNPRHKEPPKRRGSGPFDRVNTNLGTSTERVDVAVELEKLAMATEAGADTVMDLSTGGELDEIRSRYLAHARIPVGTVPIYQAAVEAVRKSGTITKLDLISLFEVIEKIGEDGSIS